MPAKSASQQKAAGAALSTKRGETPKGKLKGASRSMAESMSEDELERMASTTSVPVAATATSRSRSAPASAASRTGALLVITMSASAIRSATCSAVVRSNTTSSCGKPSGRSTVSGDSVSRSRKTTRAGRSVGVLIGGGRVIGRR